MKLLRTYKSVPKPDGNRRCLYWMHLVYIKQTPALVYADLDTVYVSFHRTASYLEEI